MPRVDPAEVLYYPPELIGSKEGAHCSICMMFWKKNTEGRCTVVAGPINGETGYCGLYVNGKHMGPTMDGKTPPDVVGYGEDGPTHCANCLHFTPGKEEKSAGDCDFLRTTVHYYGCCDAWRPLGVNA